MLQDYSVPCTIVKHHVQALFLFSLKKAELQCAAPRPLRCGWLPSLLKSILAQSWVFHHTGEHLFPFPGTESMVKKNPITSQWEKASSSFPLYWIENERLLRSQCRAETQIQSFELIPGGGSFNSRGILRRFTWELDTTRVVRIHSISVHCNHAQGKYLFNNFLKTFITSSSYLCT